MAQGQDMQRVHVYIPSVTHANSGKYIWLSPQHTVTVHIHQANKNYYPGKPKGIYVHSCVTSAPKPSWEHKPINHSHLSGHVGWPLELLDRWGWTITVLRQTCTFYRTEMSTLKKIPWDNFLRNVACGGNSVKMLLNTCRGRGGNQFDECLLFLCLRQAMPSNLQVRTAHGQSLFYSHIWRIKTSDSSFNTCSSNPSHNDFGGQQKLETVMEIPSVRSEKGSVTNAMMQGPLSQ